MNEITRILNLPVAADGRPPLPDLGPGTPSLRPAQVTGLREYVRALTAPAGRWGNRGGVIGAGCGHGKTLLGLLVPVVHHAVTGVRPRTLYLVPAPLVRQLNNDAAAWAVRFPGIADVDRHVMSHDALSAPSGRGSLRAMAPDLVVIDEAHAFANPESGRWRRVVDYVKARPDARIVVMSGSFSWHGLGQVRHVYLAALRDWCPLPADSTLRSWRTCIDVGGEPSRDDRALVGPLREWASVDDDRAAYRRRLETCPGVTLTSEIASPAALTCRMWRADATPEVAAAVADLDQRWVLPDGAELLSAIEHARHSATLALGYYQRWTPPVDPEWLDRRRAWSGKVRALVAYVPDVYQTPGAVTAYAEARKLDAHSQALYDAWCAVEHLEPPQETVWLPDAETHVRRTVEAWAADPARGMGPPLVWVASPEAGDMISRATGWAYHGAGSSPPVGKPAVVSINVHATGWDGAPAAGYRSALVAQPPASAKTWEQLLARLHRGSAGRDEIVHTVLVVGTRGYRALRSAIAGARYVQETTGASQRLLVASWDGLDVNRVDGVDATENDE